MKCKNIRKPTHLLKTFSFGFLARAGARMGTAVASHVATLLLAILVHVTGSAELMNIRSLCGELSGTDSQLSELCADYSSLHESEYPFHLSRLCSFRWILTVFQRAGLNTTLFCYKKSIRGAMNWHKNQQNEHIPVCLSVYFWESFSWIIESVIQQSIPSMKFPVCVSVVCLYVWESWNQNSFTLFCLIQNIANSVV